MADVISDYQKWKLQGEDLRTQAKQAMESRFRDLLAEAVSIAEEYKTDFGLVLKPSGAVTAFRYKPSQKSKAKKAAAKPGKAQKPAPAPPAETKPSKPDPKVAQLQVRLAAAKKKLDAAKTAGTATRLLEDRVYEIEDALRLAGLTAS